MPLCDWRLAWPEDIHSAMAMPTSTKTVNHLYRDGAAAWPAISCPREQFEEIVTASNLQDTGAANAADLYITAALMAGDPSALQAFESTYLESQRGRLVQLGLCRAGVDDALQTMRECLLLPRGEASLPRIVELAGQGDFRALFRVIAVRTGLNLLRGERRRKKHEDDAVIDRLCATDSSLRPLMRAEAVLLLREAIERAVRGLTSRERTLLRLHFSHGLTIDGIGRLYNVHRATAARWLCGVRETIESRVKDIVRENQGQTTTNLNELLHLASSQLQLSFERILATTPGAPAGPALLPDRRYGSASARSSATPRAGLAARPAPAAAAPNR